MRRNLEDVGPLKDELAHQLGRREEANEKSVEGDLV